MCSNNMESGHAQPFSPFVAFAMVGILKRSFTWDLALKITCPPLPPSPPSGPANSLHHNDKNDEHPSPPVPPHVLISLKSKNVWI